MTSPTIPSRDENLQERYDKLKAKHTMTTTLYNARLRAIRASIQKVVAENDVVVASSRYDIEFCNVPPELSDNAINELQRVSMDLDAAIGMIEVFRA